MSQFSQKYYKHYFVGKKKEVESIEFDFWVWSNRYKFFEIIVILLLLLILFCVCTRCVEPSHRSISFGMDTPDVSLASQQHDMKRNEPPVPKKKAPLLTLEEKIPKLVLPELSKLIPKKEVTLQEYMYYVNDTNKGFPSYIDAQTNRMIKEKRPSCKGVECPVRGISQEDKQAYAEWLSEQGSAKYKVVETSKGFFISQM
ncbi:SUMF1/EgtB/PvdO family nonheme iron enzyme [Sulfurimonas sp. SAG-AH-194-C20]|nr:SUMF1/EgtB/PvdO family nonheme iron enzyme [Sulfurimonas sp. SAG-AH-194-C20]MDF1878140.1 SUMF1/EgtB/PvdO family nonheme iron enzyme [Sulfurimonas sp. SAG-AH-194-C20]